MTSPAPTPQLTDADLYAELLRFGLAFANEPREYVVEVWTEDRHPREALDAVLGLMATNSPPARAFRTALNDAPPRVRDFLAYAFWDGVTVRIDREGCTP
jgi:hypothetical protein